MAADKPKRQQMNTLWEANASGIYHKPKIKAKINTEGSSLKKNFSYADSPYMQPLLPLVTKQVKYYQRKVHKHSLLDSSANCKSALHQFSAKTSKPIAEHSVRLRPITSLQCQITLKFIANHSACFPGRSHRIYIQQQHCGGNPVTVYQGWHFYDDKFSFISRRQQGYSFSITLSIDNILNLQLSACCEYKYQFGKKLGGRKSHFMLIGVKGSIPCYRCQMRKNSIERSLFSSESKVNSKVEDHDSQFSTGGESNNCESPTSAYEDDFEEDEEEMNTMHKPCAGLPEKDEEGVGNVQNEINSAEIINEVALETEEKQLHNELVETDTIASFMDEQDTNEKEHNSNSCTSDSLEPSKHNELEDGVIDNEPVTLVDNDAKVVIADDLTDKEIEITKEKDMCTNLTKEESFSNSEDNTTNDDAEQSVTSNTEFSDNSDTDEDVCYSYEKATVQSNERYSSLCDNYERLSFEQLPFYKNNAQFDSSDEEEFHQSPPLTIWADVHACEIESPAISKIG